jgi:hypothetical protein
MDGWMDGWMDGKLSKKAPDCSLLLIFIYLWGSREAKGQSVFR